jgi:hypothetical protein
MLAVTSNGSMLQINTVVFICNMLPLLVTANIVLSSLILVFLCSVLQLIVTAYSCHSDDGGDTFLQNISSYKSHTS